MKKQYSKKWSYIVSTAIFLKMDTAYRHNPITTSCIKANQLSFLCIMICSKKRDLKKEISGNVIIQIFLCAWHADFFGSPKGPFSSVGLLCFVCCFLHIIIIRIFFLILPYDFQSAFYNRRRWNEREAFYISFNT